ncbi:uncharacterized protein LOC114247409 [Bombyx mandarina]|uniref:Uncharacterized protein LOC114247409 n=1 Tax=Bombyx mandarina TaxID=7092 RepID=A0A6J2K1S3_BOMMA|nr:uncharacterized protein LOC114247409 [Bombyx mandarina]
MDLIDLNYCMTDDEALKPKAKVCFCCLNDSKTLIRFRFCKHRIFLENHFKEKLNIQNLFVCVKCHSFMKKINLFLRQVEQSYSTLKAEIPYNNANITTNLIRSNIEVISNLNDVKEIKIEPFTPQFEDDIEIEVKLEEAPNISKSTVRSLQEPLQTPHNNVNMSTILNNYNFKVISTSNDVKEIKIEPITARFEAENEIEVKFEEEHNISKAMVRRLQEPLQADHPEELKTCDGIEDCFGAILKTTDLSRTELEAKKDLEKTHSKYTAKLYKCEKCLVSYDNELHLRKHLLLRHNEKNRYKCDVCDCTYDTELKLETHARRHYLRTAYNHTIADRSDEPMDYTDPPLPSKSNILTEAQDAVAFTSFDEPSTIAAPKSKAQKQREYRQRIAASRTSAQAIAAKKSDAERQRNRRLRKAAKLALISGSLESNTAPISRSGAKSNDLQTGTKREPTHKHSRTSASEPGPITSDQIVIEQTQSTWKTKWAFSIVRFKSTFLDNDFGHACSICDRLWFKNDLKPITEPQLEVISEWFVKENRRPRREEYEMVCNTCKRSLNKKSMPPLAKVNGFSYPDEPPALPPLDPISERLISPLLPFMQVRRLRHDASYGIVGQVINLPTDVQQMVKCLPRQLNEDHVINVNIERNLAHKSEYISGYVSKSTISSWLTALQESTLYRLYEINVDLSRLHSTVPSLDDIKDDPSNRIENISAENAPDSEIFAARQHTVMWNEEDCPKITPGHQATPLNIIYDRHIEELSFPSIYFGEPRSFHVGVPVTPYMVVTSEIRRRDRRGATPQKILYVAMKILRQRMMDGIHSTFRNVSVTENITRGMLEDTEFMKEYVMQNLAFMKTVPNSVQYWASRKRDLLAMIRQLGKPTALLTISANEIRWTKLLTILLKLSKKYPGKTAKDLDTSERCALVSDDPVTCCIYFYKLVGSLMKILKSKQSYNPFGKYFVKDHFLRIEFQQRGSPHARILLWLNDDPRETVSESMPRTVDLVEKLSSVARDDVPNDSIYANQIHKHSFTCTKRGETACRFGVPYWPMPTTRVLVPMPQADGRHQNLEEKAKELRASLGERQYTSMDEFLNANGLTYVTYLDIVRSTLHRPTIVFKRNFDELMTDTFNPYLAGEVNSKIDIQFILDEHSCADYVVEYINRSARGMGDLRRELTTMMQEHPEQDYTGQLKALSVKMLNAVEMSAQEAAWYLLRQRMSEASRQIVYIPTVWPTERQCCRKRRQQMDREGIDEDSTDVWTKNIIQRYEERPESLEQVYLAEFASWYANASDFLNEEDDVHADDDEDSEAIPETRTSRASKEYRRRPLGRIIRYRRYDIDDTDNYKREMVLLYVRFRNEMSEIVDQNKFLQLFDENEDTIMERHRLFETNINIENVVKELEVMTILENDNNGNQARRGIKSSVCPTVVGKRWCQEKR